ncbi:hypothetical protein J3R30DRAFT_1064333 [Lentinula aciculospora]|uniref:C2 domain-containing protein n=1 Tax=Lentinula aciculospora TaxID=153920 RepID=A0A9W9DIK4_9AGAR|nr:hypothetical protein J3R30DRAFT_1064333 [Lentinula aciculospora]
MTYQRTFLGHLYGLPLYLSVSQRRDSSKPLIMTTTPREIGTLVVVVLKANHLPNKRHIGKQDPYCAVTFDGQTRRTKAIKKGGQHPEWDEEIRFQLYEDDEEPPEPELATGGTPPPLPPKSDKPSRIKGGTFMKLAAYADDAREPDLIGEGLVDLEEVITKGESDGTSFNSRLRLTVTKLTIRPSEWYTLTYKDRFAGKVYLEMTLYSNEPEPPKKKKAAVYTNNSEYIGPGVFVEESAEAPNRIVSASVVHDHNRRISDSYSIRPSSSLAQLDLYQAPYEQNQSVDSLTRNFGEFGVSNGRRRETLPSSISSYRSTSSTGFSTISSQSSLYEPNGSTYRSVTPNGQVPYPGEHDIVQPQPSSYRPPPPVRKARYSIPASSSGFVPLSNSSSALHNSASSVLNMQLPTGGYPPPPPSQTPISAYNPSVLYDTGAYPAPSQTPLPPNGTSPVSYDAGIYPPAPSQTPFPTPYTTNLPHSHSFEHGSSLSPPESYVYPHQGSSPVPPPPPLPSQLVPHSTPPEVYTGYAVSSPSWDHLGSSNGSGGSRPLPPQPQGVPPPPPPLSLDHQQYGTYNNSYMNLPVQAGASSFPSIPLPMPSPQSQSSLNGSPQSHFPFEGRMSTLPSKNLPVPPPPHTSHRRTSLPQPPIQGNTYPPLPQPPSDFRSIPPPPTSQLQSFHPGPPPRPPAQSIYYHEPVSPPQTAYHAYQA